MVTGEEVWPGACKCSCVCERCTRVAVLEREVRVLLCLWEIRARALQRHQGLAEGWAEDGLGVLPGRRRRRRRQSDRARRIQGDVIKGDVIGHAAETAARGRPRLRPGGPRC